MSVTGTTIHNIYIYVQLYVFIYNLYTYMVGDDKLFPVVTINWAAMLIITLSAGWL